MKTSLSERTLNGNLGFKIFLFLIGVSTIVGFNLFRDRSSSPSFPFATALKRDIFIEVKTIGVVESSHSVTIASTLKGDIGKIIHLVRDGEYVKKGDVLVKIDPSPFEEKCAKARFRVKEQKAIVYALKQALEWEIQQAEHKNKAAELEEESVLLELEKIARGEGPKESLRLKAALQKAESEFEELRAYASDLSALQEEGFLNISEVKQIEKKIQEHKEVYECAKQQYENFEMLVYPMQIKKGETLVKKQQVIKEEVKKNGLYAISKAKAQLNQAKQMLNEEIAILRDAKRELSQTDIVAPSSGLVVLREDFRSGQKRKPRVGDILVKNQPLIELPNLQEMIVKTRVREVDLFKVEVGRKASISIDAYPSLYFSGKVSSIGVLALSDTNQEGDEKYFEVVVNLNESDPRLRPGMTARLAIHGEERINALSIPVYSIFGEGKKDFCYVCGPRNSFEQREVQLGIADDQWIEILSGLNEGENICLTKPSL